MGTTLFDRAMDNFDAVGKNLAEHNKGRSEVYAAKARFHDGEISAAEAMRLEAAGEKRTDRGTFGAIGRTLLGAAQLVPYAILPSLLIVDAATNRPDSEAKEKNTSFPESETGEKQKLSTDEKQKLLAAKTGQPSGVLEAETLEAAAPESGDRVHVVEKGDSIWKIVEKDYRLHHNGEINNKIINERTKALVAIHGETIHAGESIELPALP